MGRANPEYANYLADLLSPLGPIHWRAMFGGYGVYCGDLFFALAVDDVLYLKADGESRERFEQAGLPPFTYEKQGTRASISYYQAPDEIFDDEEALRDWGNLALAAALRARKPVKKPAPAKTAAAKKPAAKKPVVKVQAVKKPAARKKPAPA